MSNRTGVRTGLLISSSPASCLALAVFLTALSVTYGDDKTKPAEPTIRVSPDFAELKIETIRVLGKPAGNSNLVKSSIYDGVTSILQEHGYTVVSGFAYERKEGEGRLTIDMDLTRGTTSRAYMTKMGFRGGADTENYTLTATARITGAQGKPAKEAYFAKCKMWHKFVARMQTSHVSGDWIITNWPVDYFGEGPMTVAQAANEMPVHLMRGLPKKSETSSASGGTQTTRSPPAAPGARTSRTPASSLTNGSLETEDAKIAESKGGGALVQQMGNLGMGWSGDAQLFFAAREKDSFVTIEVPSVEKEGHYLIEVYYTLSYDYGLVELSIDDRKIGKATDCYAPRVKSPIKVTYGPVRLEAKPHQVTFTVIEKNPASQGYKLGIDCLKFKLVSEKR